MLVGLLVVLLLSAGVAPRVAVGSGDARTPTTSAGPALSLTAPRATLPTAPQDVAATPEIRAVNLTWVPPTSNGGTPLTGYTVRFAPVQNGTGEISLGLTTHTWISGLLTGEAYEFEVAARNRLGTGPFSFPSTQAVPGAPPLAPTNLSVSSGNETATLSWSPPSGNSMYGITGYIVNVSSPSGTTYDPILRPPLVLEALVDGESYRASVRAVNQFGNGSASTGIEFTPYGPPGAPMQLTATYEEATESILVSWATPSWSGGSPLENFTVQWATSNGSMGTVHTGVNDRSWTFKGAYPGLTYTFDVQASGRGGTGLGASIFVTIPVLGAAILGRSPLVVLAEFLGIIAVVYLLLLIVSRRRRRAPPSAPPARPPPRSPVRRGATAWGPLPGDPPLTAPPPRVPSRGRGPGNGPPPS